MPALAPGFLIHPSGQLCVKDEPHFTDDKAPPHIASITCPDKWEFGNEVPSLALSRGQWSSLPFRQWASRAGEMVTLFSPDTTGPRGTPSKPLLMNMIVHIHVHMHSLTWKSIHCAQFHGGDKVEPSGIDSVSPCVGVFVCVYRWAVYRKCIKSLVIKVQYVR